MSETADTYVRSLLVDGESIRAEAKQHWFALIRYSLRPILIAIAALICFAIGVWLNPTGDGLFDQIARWIDTLLGLLTAALVVWAIVWLPVQGYRWFRRRYIVTDRRVLYVVGAWRRQVTDIGLNMITDVGFRQSIMGRQLGYGELSISTASNRGLTFNQIRDALEFRKAIMDAQRATIEARADQIMASKGQLPASPATGAGEPVAGAATAAAVEEAADPDPDPGWDGSDMPQMIEDDLPPPLPGAFTTPADGDSTETGSTSTPAAVEPGVAEPETAPAPETTAPAPPVEPEPSTQVAAIETAATGSEAPAGGHVAAMDEVDASMAGVADGAKGSGAESVTAAIARLADLHDSGALTDAEFEAQKQELLGRL